MVVDVAEEDNEHCLLQVDTTVLGLSKDEALKKPYIASMGVYVFKKEILLNLLSHPGLAFYAAKPMYTSRRNLPPSKIDNSKDTVMLGADFYETEAEVAALLAEGRVPN
ncbi:Nucleotide-diphospho-sugar transferase [Sesbania bispinosa]|nr:Nucleotide-diphospho-sugar transferase [Sesbania bispinosa]